MPAAADHKQRVLHRSGRVARHGWSTAWLGLRVGKAVQAFRGAVEVILAPRRRVVVVVPLHAVDVRQGLLGVDVEVILTPPCIFCMENH